MDNCSTDGSSEVATNYVSQFPGKIRLVRTESFLSQVQNYNFALSCIAPNSKYCKIVQADDWIYADCLDRMVALAESDPSIGIVSSYRLRGNRVMGEGLPCTKSVISGADICRLHLTTALFAFGSPTTTLYRSEIVRNNSPFYDEGTLHDDTDACYRVLRYWNFGFVHQVLSVSRVDNDSIMSRARDFRWEYLDGFLQVCKFGPVYLKRDELAILLRDWKKLYYGFLARRLLSGGSRAFWQYHLSGLRNGGQRLEKARLLKHACLELLRLLTNPGLTTMRLYDRLRRRARQSPAKSTSTVASPISMKETTVVAQHPSGKGFGSDACLLLIALLGSFLLAQAPTAPNAPWIAFNRAGAPNSSLQCFTPSNVKVSDGNLVILTKADTATCSSFDLSSATYNYTSGFVSMRNFNFLYGTVEFRAKFGGGVGTGAWPTVWMEDASCQASDPTGTDERCNGQEIDIAEILNSDFTHINQQIHVDNFNHNDGCTAYATDTSQNFHVYQLVWSASSLVFRIDGTTTCVITRSYVPNAAMYVKIGMFVGKYGGPVKNSSLPWKTLIDYVRVTQGSTVVFSDDFTLASTIQPGQAASDNASSRSQLAQREVPKTWLWQSLAALIFCLTLLGTAIALRRKGVEE